jgi:hypothetical protein
MNILASRYRAGLLFILLCSGCSRVEQLDHYSIEQRIRTLLRLHTAESIYRDLVYFGEEKTVLIFRTMDRQLLFSADIRVTAGIEFTEPIDVTLDPDRPEHISVTLPPARILEVDLDEESLVQYFIRQRGGRIGILEYGERIEEMKEAIARDAENRGLLIRATGNVRRVVVAFLEMAGFRDITVR